MGKMVDLTGQRFGRLTVVTMVGLNNRHMCVWLCKCDCGNELRVASSNLIWGNTKSCGCLRRDAGILKSTTHGKSGTRLYKIWAGMKKRCQNVSSHAYGRYGGRGIGVCEEWQQFSVFYDWAIKNGYRDDLTLERKDNNQGYSPFNCVWSTYKCQARNIRSNRFITHNGLTLCMSEWAERSGMERTTLWARLKSGWDMERCINTPVRR